jgi:hypothetical protein
MIIEVWPFHSFPPQPHTISTKPKPKENVQVERYMFMNEKKPQIGFSSSNALGFNLVYHRVSPSHYVQVVHADRCQTVRQVSAIEDDYPSRGGRLKGDFCAIKKRQCFPIWWYNCTNCELRVPLKKTWDEIIKYSKVGH